MCVPWKRKFCGQINLGHSHSREDFSPSGRVRAEFPHGQSPVFPHGVPGVSETQCRA